MGIKLAKRRKQGFYLGDPKVKGIIIGSAGLIVVVMAIFIIQWLCSDDANRLAALRYNFNNYYQNSFNHVEDDSVSDMFNSVSSRAAAAKLDSDNDGISDDVERLLGMDINSNMSDGQTYDKDRLFTRSFTFDEGGVTLTGDANVYTATVDKLSLNAVRSNAGILTSPYEIYCSSDFESAKIRFRYDFKKLNIIRANAKSLHVYKFDPYSKTYKLIGGNVIEGETAVECDITENGVYLLGSDMLIDKSAEAYVSEQYNIHLIIDNSGSLYASTDTYESEENDLDFKRLTFARKFVNDFPEGANFAISVFTYDFKTLCEFDNNKSHVVDAIESIRTLGAGFDGTSVERAMVLGLDSFDESKLDERNIIVLLTDGISTNTAGYSLDSILTRAKAKNVTAITISLGNSYDRELLENIADSTGGKYYQISQSNLLENLHATMMLSMDDDIIDDNDDGTPDSYMLYDTGFDVNTDACNFKAYRNEDAQLVDFGMSLFAKDWYRNDLDRQAKNMIGDVLDMSEPLHKYSSQMLQQYAKPEDYLEFRSTSDTLFVGKVRNEAVAKGWKAIQMPYEDTTAGWSKVELLVPGLSTNLIESAYGAVDDMLFKLIDYYDNKLPECKPYEIIDDAAISKTKQILGGGNPMVMKLSWQADDKYLSRYVLLTSLRRDLDNPNVFKMKVYDSVTNDFSNVILTRYQSFTGGRAGSVYTGIWNDKTVIATGCPE